MSTKERILETSLLLFNEFGTESVTVRHIAERMHISHGNLCYHYPNKEALIIALYEQLVNQLNQKVTHYIGKEISIIDMQASLIFVISLFYKYKFLMQNFTNIMRIIPYIREHYIQICIQRKKEFQMIHNQLIHNNILIPEPYKGAYDALYIRVHMMGDFWIPFADIHLQGSDNEKIQQFVNQIFELYFPYFTNDTKLLFHNLNSNNSI
ncbi:MAG: TetR/AcrR family transcriptional regulator [Bacteroidota bacterium]|nr:TetR/AcrR family transcriptional regulator [Bacteroidota bacterium]